MSRRRFCFCHIALFFWQSQGLLRVATKHFIANIHARYAFRSMSSDGLLLARNEHTRELLCEVLCKIILWAIIGGKLLWVVAFLRWFLIRFTHDIVSYLEFSWFNDAIETLLQYFYYFYFWWQRCASPYMKTKLKVINLVIQSSQEFLIPANAFVSSTDTHSDRLSQRKWESEEAKCMIGKIVFRSWKCSSRARFCLGGKRRGESENYNKCQSWEQSRSVHDDGNNKWRAAFGFSYP